MFEGRRPESARHYCWVGEQTVALLHDALAAAGRSFEGAARWLDFGCGHGRVLRVLVQHVPAAHITACDLDPEAVAFCASEFRAVPLVSSLDIEAVPLASYDVIWMGSVLTHIAEPAALRVLSSLASHLTDQGVLVFTTHGDTSEEFLRSLAATLPSRRAEIQSRLAADGFAYVPYPHYRSDDYGLSWHRPQWVEQNLSDGLGLKRILYREKGWAGTQDAWAFSQK
jgi:SAM-dependent methyltransferase